MLRLPTRLHEVSFQEKIFYFEEAEPRRLDHFLVGCMPEFSRSQLQRLIKDGLVSVDDAVAPKAGVKLEGQETVAVLIPPPKPTRLVPENIPLDVVFENGDVIVVDKPAGMVVHPSAGHESGTLVHAVLALAADIEGVGGEQRPGIVHRLDKDTSGLIILAKNDRAHRHLQTQFHDRTVKKHYLALVDGAPPTPTGRVEAPVGRHPSHRMQMAVLPQWKGREAVSEYHTLESFARHTLLDVQIFTGRTHQIRLHMAFLGCPVAGDTLYGRRKPTLPVGRQFLHAARLGLRLPGDRQMRFFEAPLPADLEEVLENLRTTH